VPVELCFDEFPPSTQIENHEPVDTGLCQKVTYGLFSHGMDSGNTQQVLLGMPRENEGIAFVTY
jgi:hypothetical protein